jgi:hypothetical protein
MPAPVFLHFSLCPKKIEKLGNGSRCPALIGTNEKELQVMKLLSTTALAALALTASSVWASEHSTSAEKSMDASNGATMEASSDDAMSASDQKNMDMASMAGDLIRTRDITGGNIYTVNEADDEGWDPTMVYNEVGADWNDIGEIEDLVLSRDGKIIGIVAEVGGFLDIGDKHVVISVDDLSLVAVDDTTYAYVTRLNEEDLESMQSVDEGFWN